MIYCVEDDNSIRDLMIYTLTLAGFETKGFADSKSFWEGIKERQPELILLDIMLPGEDGISVLKKLRSNTSTAAVPVIMATAKGSEYDRVIGLDLGADDYLCKPFGMMEMTSRIKAVLRRASYSERRSLLSYKAIIMDPARHAVTANGREISLTLKSWGRAANQSAQSGALATGSDDTYLVCVYLLIALFIAHFNCIKETCYAR